ncbi:hypothetical protein SPRG_22281 [Saprolegnia parasitica CBS 223.65]|uniref:Uncharacterized protein n=1 Tax=Saprolegnia parasitica (strain CBS 223.65) TaxID=695850 RepID=A0A067CAC0_SAPPC|nr:hypothetical protein SPRG_22281 [Saprolegnia parasitica CBS 223.65]KDO23501.1 hypothetical protein SPRG_22281 [Saprolegnia parasitica CBS 223.65]|eukprot:XP_012205846.1 hypothetical protein SPRG_22281 [Saprolegnia parasitica CBS 223.65]
MLSVAASIGLSAYALAVFASYLKTDYFFPNFNTAAPILVAILNHHLVLSRSGNIDVFGPQSSFVPSLQGTSPAYPRLIMYQELTRLLDGVRGLRRLDATQVVKMVSPYCWADLNKTYELAYTTKRQARCAQYEATNGAVHLETVLRNIDFSGFVDATQGLFLSAIAHPIARSGPAGAAWLSSLETHVWAAESDEVALWASCGLDRYTLQYGTGISIGVSESILVETALGQRLSLPLKTIPSTNRWTFRTTRALYNLLYNDLYANGANGSLVRGTTNYFGDVDASRIEAFATQRTLKPVQEAVHYGLGSFGSIDAKWVPPPPRLLTAVQAFEATLIAALVASTTLPSVDMSRETLLVTPRRWRDRQLGFVSGNPMCTLGRRQSFVQQTFRFDDVCGSQTPLTLEWHSFNAVFAFWLLGGSVSTTDVCASFPSDAIACQRLVAKAKTLYDALSLPPLDQVLLSDLSSLDVGFLQIFYTNQTAISMDQQLLLAPDFSFLGAMYVYDWALNFREVVSFQGDVATYTLLSGLYAPVVADPIVPPAALGPYLWYLATVTTGTLAILAGLVFGLRCVSGDAGYDWFHFAPLVASVWVSRNFLVFRSAAAILCLATAPLDTTALHDVARLVLAPRSIATSSVLALDCLWLAHVAHGVLLPLSAAWSALPIPFLGWLAIVLLDQLAPVALTSSLDRQCFAINMDQMTYCANGVISVGRFERSVALVAVVGAVITASFVWSLWYPDSTSASPRPSAVIPPIAPLHATSTGHRLSLVTAIMCGLVPLTWRNRVHVFDLKLWLLIQSDDEALDSTVQAPVTLLPFSAPSILSLPSRVSHSVLGRKSVQSFLRCTGLAYIGITLWSNAAYLSVLETALANDYGWAGFNATGMHAFLANTFNRQLLTSTDASIALHDPAFGDPLQSYNSSAITVAWYPTVARRYLFNASAPLHELVAGLRAMHPCQLPWMFTQYCWLDLDRTWEMASTSQRQVRCADLSQHNGARYLETSLRNVQDWAVWQSCWGSSFDIGIGNDLAASEAGRQWLHRVQTNALSVPEEVEYWSNRGISVFLLQWQNFKDTGLSDSMVISTPFGLSYTLPISERRGVVHLDYQTSHRMYWGLASDRWAVSTNATSIGGLSLLRNSPHFAFANATRASLLFENLTLSSPLNAGLALYDNSLGPFGAVDMVYVSCPTSLLALYRYILHAIATVTSSNLEAQRQFLNLPAKTYIGQLPQALLNDTSLRLVGGNLMCGSDLPGSRPSRALLTLYGIDTVCSWQYLDFFTPSTTGLVFALAAFDAVHRVQPTVDFRAFCASDVYAEPNCEAIYLPSHTFATSYFSDPTTLGELAVAAEADTHNLSIEMTQYINRTSNIELYRINILDPTDRTWMFFGWNYLADWVVGKREVVSFQGDGGTVTAMSRYTTLSTLSLTEAVIPTRLSYVCQQCVRYVTGAMMVGAGVAAYYAIFVCRGCIEGMNLFSVNRLIGHAWIGRTLLIIRGITALWLLNTPSLQLLAFGVGARFQASPLAWFPTLLATSELTWLVYIANDLLIAAAWSSMHPQEYTTSVRRTCSYIDMDVTLVCTSGYVELGHWSRVGVDVGLCLSCVLLMACVERLRHPNLPLVPTPSLLLNTTSVYSSNMTNWIVHGHAYMDRMTAVMGGLLTWRYHGVLHVFDIKCWRTFVVVPEAECPFEVGAVLPLHRIC